MANTKTSDELAAGALTGAELVRLVQSGADVQSTTAAIAALAASGGAPTNAEYITASANATLSAERVLTDSSTIAKNTAVAGQVAFDVINSSITDAKLANAAANTVKCNATASAAAPSNIAIGASQLFGRGSTGNLAPITLGTNLSMTGTTLNAAGGGGGGAPTDADYIVITANAGLSAERVFTDSATVVKNTATAGQVSFDIPDAAVTNAKMANAAANSIKGNATASVGVPTDITITASKLFGRGSTGNLSEITLGTNLSMTGTTLDAAGGGGSSGSSVPMMAKIPLIFDVGVLNNDPGNGKSKMNTAVTGTGKLFWIDDLNADGVNQEAWIQDIKSGDKLVYRDVTDTLDYFTVTFTGTPADQAGWWQIACNVVVNVLPADEELCIVYYISKGASAILLKTDNFARYSFGGSGGSIDGFLLPDGVLASFGNPIYTFASLPAITAANDGAVVRIDPSSFPGTHVCQNIFAVANLADNCWDPVNSAQLIYAGYGSDASPLASMAGIAGHAETMFTITANPQFPANFFKLGRGVRVVAKFQKTGAGAGVSVFAAQFGKNNTTADQLIASVTTTAVAEREAYVDAVARVTAVGAGTSVFTSDFLGPNNQATTAITDKSTSFDSTLASYVSFTHDPSTDTDTAALSSYQVWWVR